MQPLRAISSMRVTPLVVPSDKSTSMVVHPLGAPPSTSAGRNSQLLPQGHSSWGISHAGYPSWGGKFKEGSMPPVGEIRVLMSVLGTNKELLLIPLESNLEDSPVSPRRVQDLSSLSLSESSYDTQTLEEQSSSSVSRTQL